MSIYYRNLSSEPVFCLGCASVLPPFTEQELVCPRCGHRMTSKGYRQILEIAYSAARYGYQYRRQHESDRANGITGRHYYLVELSRPFEWIALAIVSGVLGNAAWEVIKIVVQRAVDYANENRNSLKDFELKILDSPDKMEEFTQYVKEYNCRDAPGARLTESELKDIWDHIDRAG